METKRTSLALAQLRARMFKRGVGDPAFNPLSEKDLIRLVGPISQYKREGRFIVARESNLRWSLRSLIATLRRNHLFHESVSPRKFRGAATRVAEALLAKAERDLGINPRKATVCLPWRAGLAFAKPAFKWGCRSWHNLGVCRDEKTAEPMVFYQDDFVLRPDHVYIVADPMLATGGTIEYYIRYLLDHGVSAENILVVSIFSAPEGIDRLLDQFPRLRILVAEHDHHLNAKAYIVPGCGDFGDQYFEGLGVLGVRIFRRMGIVGPRAHGALLERMAA